MNPDFFEFVLRLSPNPFPTDRLEATEGYVRGDRTLGVGVSVLEQRGLQGDNSPYVYGLFSKKLLDTGSSLGQDHHLLMKFNKYGCTSEITMNSALNNYVVDVTEFKTLEKSQPLCIMANLR